MNFVAPHSCIGLAVGVPTSSDAFVQRVECSDFLSKFNMRRPDGTLDETPVQALWRDHYGPMIGQPLARLIDTAHSLGVRVAQHATLNDVAEFSACCNVLIVVAHWKGSEVLYEDLSAACTLPAVLDRARQHDSDMAAWLIERATRNQVRPFFAPFPPPVTVLLREAVDLGWSGQARREIVDGRTAMPITLAEHRRKEIDELLTGLIQPGNRLELFDGMHDKETFEQALDAQFEGFLDLTTCTSTILADHLSRARGARLRLLQFPRQQEFLWHAQCLALALEWTIGDSMPYVDARQLAHQLLEQALRDLKGEP